MKIAMTKVFNIAIKQKSQDELKYSLYYNFVKQKVLRCVFQTLCFVKDSREKILVSGFSSQIYREISQKTNIQEFLVKIIIEEFLQELQNFRKFWKHCNIKWNHRKERVFAKVRIYLHKLHRIAPVFDYRRARKNLNIFHKFLRMEHFWPQISTQLAIVIYITDLNDSEHQDRLRIQNIRMLVNSSAYAFYGIRKRLIEKGVLCINE
jgi:GTP-sensing pleiotropic transcriptional regulator CodY